MTRLSLVLAAALVTSAALPAMAADTKPVTNPDTASVRQATAPRPATNMPSPAANNAQAGVRDMGNNAAPNTQTAMNMSAGMDISSAPSATQRKGTNLTASQRARADAEEAETTRQLNMQAAAMAAPDRTALR